MRNKEIFFTTKNIKNKKVVLLSDIHYSKVFNVKIFDRIIDQISDLNVDYILILIMVSYIIF